MKHSVEQELSGAEFDQTLALFRGAVHQAAAQHLPPAPNASRLQGHAVRKQRHHSLRLLVTWTLGPVLAVLLVIGIYFRPRTAVQPAASYAAASALLEQVNEEISETAPGPLQPLYGPATTTTTTNTTTTTHENPTTKVTK